MHSTHVIYAKKFKTTFLLNLLVLVKLYIIKAYIILNYMNIYRQFRFDKKEYNK